MFYLDPLYGQLEISEKELALFQTKALTRLRDVSLSAVHPLISPFGMVGSRFEHSVGVGFLAKKLTQKKDFKKMAKNLYLAALLHDIGSPPFSHLTERFQREITGKNHEEFVETILKEKNLQKAIKRYGGDVETVSRLVKGKYLPWSDLINGSIDLDNLDNTLRWGLGAGVFKSKFYDPEEIVNIFVFKDKKLALKIEYQANIQTWELARRLAYDLVYSNLNLAPGSMITRALQFAFENNELDGSFFYLTDSQAFYLLENRFNSLTQKLTKAARFWQFYFLAADKITEEPSPKIKELCSSFGKITVLNDMMAQSLKIPREDICLYAGKDKGFKKIHLPFIGEEIEQYHLPIIPLKWRVKVFLHPKHRNKEKAARSLLSEIS